MTPRDLPIVEPTSNARAHAAPAVRVTLSGHSPYSSPQSEPLDVRAASLPGGDWLVEVRAGPRKLRALRLALWKLGGALGLLARAPGTALQRARELPAKRPATAPPEPMPAALIEHAAPAPEAAQALPDPAEWLPATPPATRRAPRKLMAALASLLVAAVGALLGEEAAAPAQRDAGVSAAPAPELGEVPTFAARADEAAVAALLVLAAPIPPRPYEKQARPPCREMEGEEEINGGCWIPLDPRKVRPPCRHEHAGGCYVPVAKETRRPAAVQRDAGL